MTTGPGSTSTAPSGCGRQPTRPPATSTAGIEAADSWATDGHKWLNVPYDVGYAFCAHPGAHAAAMSYTAAYLTGQGQGGLRAPGDYVLESSRRARGFATWAALRQLGRTGVAELVERCCALARRFAEQLGAIDGVTIANDVVLNQVLVSFGEDERTDRVIEKRPALGRVLDGRHHLARPASHAHRGVELAHHRGRCRPLGRRHLGGDRDHLNLTGTIAPTLSRRHVAHPRRRVAHGGTTSRTRGAESSSPAPGTTRTRPAPEPWSLVAWPNPTGFVARKMG